MTNEATLNRAYSAAHFVLELDQQERVGFLRSVSGGSVKAETITYQMGNSKALWKQMSKPKYEDVSIEVGMAMGATFCDWIESFVRGEVVRKSGAILAGDFHYKERAKREFFEALMTELTIPKLDASDKNPCYMTVKIAPERITFGPGSNQPLDHYVGDPRRQKLWTPSNFSLTIDDGVLSAAMRRVTKIDALTIKQKILEYPSGNRRDAMRVPGRLEYPNLTFYLPEADAKPFMDRITKRVMDGEVAPPERLTGALMLRDNTNADLCTISLTGVDVATVSPEKSETTGDTFKLVKVELTVESMSFEYVEASGGDAGAGGGGGGDDGTVSDDLSFELA